MSTKSHDPLTLLRAALSTSQTIDLLVFPADAPTPLNPANGTQVYQLAESTHIALPTPSSSRQIFPKTTPTRFLDMTGQSSYDLQSLLFVFLNTELAGGEYMKMAALSRLTTPVPITERRMVVDWLAGRAEMDARIQPLESDVAGKEKRALADEDQSAAAASGSKEPVQKKQRYVPNKADVEAIRRMNAIVEGPAYATGIGQEVKVEKSGGAIKNRETVLKGERLNNFESARALAAPRIAAAKKEMELVTPSAAAAAPMKPVKKKPQHPIIMISPSSTALITMHNVKRFLEDSIFEESNQARARGSRSVEDMVIVEHARSTTSISHGAGEGRKQRFFVVDGVEALSKFGGLEEAWDRVVCVMTTGQEWQFRPYKWSEPKELFHHVKGIFFQWTQDAPNPKVRGWNVTELRIDPNKRHIDKSTVADFWRNLEAWMAMNRPHLLP